MNRQRLLIPSTVVLLVLAVFYWIWSDWGLVTVDVKGKPLAEVIRSIEKQGGIVLKTNMDPTKPITMNVHKVPLTEALETLQELTDSRWRLGYFFAGDAGAIKGALDTYATGKRPEGWSNFEVPLFGRPGGADDLASPLDPRRDVWNVNEPSEKTLQGFMKAAATGVSASFACPEGFNPPVGKAPSSGEIRKAAAKLAKNAGAKMEEVFVLMGRPVGLAESDRDRADRDGEDRPGRPPRGSGGGGGGGGAGDSRRPPNFEMMRARQLAEIAKLPASEQAAAKAEFDEREQFFTSMRDLSSDERRAKMEEYFNKPENQDKMADRKARGDERKSPEQRLQKYQRYVEKKQEIVNSRTTK